MYKFPFVQFATDKLITEPGPFMEKTLILQIIEKYNE